jgi:hypothetical protein
MLKNIAENVRLRDLIHKVDGKLVDLFLEEATGSMLPVNDIDLVSVKPRA